MGAALPIGVSSSCELIDITLETSLEPDELIPRLNRFLPEHVAMLTAVKLDVKAPPLPKLVRSLSYQVRLADLAGTGVSPAELQSRVDAINAPGSFLVQRTRKSNTGEAKVSSIDLKESLEALILDDGHVRFTMYAPNGQSVSPHLVLDALVGPRVNDGRQILIHKTGFLSTAERQSLI
jgi:radical SAM-linked protein